MCGIAGIVDPTLSAAEIRNVLQRMTDAIIHRGPDDEGFFAADGVGLGIRRLKIIDVAGGHQPIANEDGRIHVVFNGEIYNFLDLRSSLTKRGHTFRTCSDTEVIAHLYEEHGERCSVDLRGMFAFAVWDQHRRRLLLSRDRLGKKPLYYTVNNNRLIFGSEIKSILAADPSLAEPDPQSVIPYFQYGFVPEPRTMFRHIRKVPASHWLAYENDEAKITPYWNLTFNADHAPHRSSTEIIEELDALLEEAVRIRLMSEVPLGVFLSGGLDSSTIVAYAHKAGLRPLKTFTVGFDRPEWDESADAQVVANHFGTEHHTLHLREQDLSHNLPETLLTLVRHFDEPFGDSSSLPTYYVSKLAREHVTVILGGDGGDELFAGYSSYRGIRFAEQYRRLPAWLGAAVLPGVVQRGAQALPPGRRYEALRVAKVLRDSHAPFETTYFRKAALSDDAILKRLFASDVAHAAAPGVPASSQDIGTIIRSSLPALSKASYVDLRFNLLDDILVKVDRMSMAHSLEVRSPFLDHHLVEFAANLPPSWKLRGWQTKAVLRDAVRGYLPPTTLRKPKQGFSVPLREWLRTGLREMVTDYLQAAHGRLPQDLFDLSSVRILIDDHHRGKADYSSTIWLLLNYAAWHDLYVR